MNANDKIPLVEVFFGTPWEAELVKGLLESAGIDAALKNYNLVNFAPSQGTTYGAGGGISVIVSAEDYDVASEIVATREQP
ncbi:DUF2007-related protein [uncultured Bacteroides sp.]|uniref:DUF2007-related protein n=1 Tax=uncultured Bacteroides sp. TaxID=162156 RepID=UPI002AAA8532|nr:DUF2007-related protein [uncultured Bacteroides sp.]